MSLSESESLTPSFIDETVFEDVRPFLDERLKSRLQIPSELEDLTSIRPYWHPNFCQDTDMSTSHLHIGLVETLSVDSTKERTDIFFVKKKQEGVQNHSWLNESPSVCVRGRTWDHTHDGKSRTKEGTQERTDDKRSKYLLSLPDVWFYQRSLRDVVLRDTVIHRKNVAISALWMSSGILLSRMILQHRLVQVIFDFLFACFPRTSVVSCVGVEGRFRGRDRVRRTYVNWWRSLTLAIVTSRVIKDHPGTRLGERELDGGKFHWKARPGTMRGFSGKTQNHALTVQQTWLFANGNKNCEQEPSGRGRRPTRPTIDEIVWRLSTVRKNRARTMRGRVRDSLDTFLMKTTMTLARVSHTHVQGTIRARDCGSWNTSGSRKELHLLKCQGETRRSFTYDKNVISCVSRRIVMLRGGPINFSSQIQFIWFVFWSRIHWILDWLVLDLFLTSEEDMSWVLDDKCHIIHHHLYICIHMCS